METELRVFTDGGCSGNPGPGGWAFVLVADDQIIAEKWGAEKNTTNNRMELTAAIAALEAVRDMTASGQAAPDRITVYTDSQYVQKGMTEWIHGWKKKQWQTSGKEAVKNQDLWQRLDGLTGQSTVVWVWIRGHTGNELNERCDRMTQEAIASLS
jgi:ribonuclease HI